MMMKLAFAGAVALVTVVPAQSSPAEAKAIKDFRKAFKSTAKRPKPLTDRIAACKKLAGLDSRRIAQLLATSFQSVDAEIETEDATRLSLNDEMRKIIKGQEHDENRTIPQKDWPRYQELKKLFKDQRAKLDNLRVLQGALATLIRDLRKYESLSWLVKNVLTNRRYSLMLKMTVCSSAGGLTKSLLDDMKKSLAKARQPLDLVALLDGIGHIGKDAHSLGPAILKLFKHKVPAVVERAAMTVAKIQFGEGVEPLIGLLEKSDGTLKKRISYALEDLTAQKHGTSVTAWRGWFEKEGKALVASGKLTPKEGSDMFRAREVGGEAGRYYMGIPQDGEAIIYVIDSSGSMKKPVKWGRPGSKKGGATVARMRGEKEGGKWDNTRLGACKQELIAALEKLTRTKTFNIVWYSDLPHQWKESMQKALPSNIKAAQDWVRKLKPNSMTNIHDALQVAFTFAKGRGLKDKAYGKGKVGLDTIFLLTDGTPTTPSGAVDDHNKILTAVQGWNPLRRVTIHTIGIGEGLNLNFMEALAQQNGGQFSHYTDNGERKR